MMNISSYKAGQSAMHIPWRYYMLMKKVCIGGLIIKFKSTKAEARIVNIFCILE